MSSLSLATHGIAGGGNALALATHGLVPEGSELLPPLPIVVPIARPADPPRVRTKYPNPRPITPNLDGGLRRNPAPGCSLVEGMAETVDDLRQIAVDMGLRYYEVFAVVVRWSGGARHRGTAAVVAETPFLPVPEVTGIANVSRELRAGGAVKRGEIWLRKLSPRYTQDDILLLFPRELRDDEEHFIEVRGDARDGNTVRDRYTIVGRPERKAFSWEVKLAKQDEDRTREGRPR